MQVTLLTLELFQPDLVDRIEIVSQGSSAIYGSDAVTGVINIITTTGKDFSEFDVDIYANRAWWRSNS